MLASLSLAGSLAGCTQEYDTCADGDFRCSMIADTSGTATTGDACFADDPPPVLQIVNDTGNAIEFVFFVRCDGTDPSEFPLMPPGLATGMSLEIPLPAPGCWLLNYSGEGCEGDMPHETATDVCAGETYVWDIDLAHHLCVG